MPSAVPSASFNRLVRRSLSLRQLYRGAIKISEPGLGTVLRENAHTLGLLIADLQRHLELAGVQPSFQSSWNVRTGNHIVIAILRISRAGDAGWLQWLAHREARLLKHFERALVGLDTPWSGVLRRQLCRLHGIALDMDSLMGPQGH